MQLHVLSAMLVDSIMLLPLCIFSTGYPLSIEYSLKFYFSSSKLKMDLPLCIYQSFWSTGQSLNIICKHQGMILGKTDHQFNFSVNDSMELFDVTIDKDPTFKQHVSSIYM